MTPKAPIRCVVKDFDTIEDAEAWIKAQDTTPKPNPTEPPIDFEVARLSAEHGMRTPFNHLNKNLGRAYLSLAAEVEQWRSDPLVAGAVEVRRKAGLADPEVLALRAEVERTQNECSQIRRNYLHERAEVERLKRVTEAARLTERLRDKGYLETENERLEGEVERLKAENAALRVRMMIAAEGVAHAAGMLRACYTDDPFPMGGQARSSAYQIEQIAKALRHD